MGFAMDESSGWCLWFDDAKPQSKDVCTSQTETEYVKKWQAPNDKEFWLAMQKLHIFDTALIKKLDIADPVSDDTGMMFWKWWEEVGAKLTDTSKALNSTGAERNSTKKAFNKQLSNYSGIVDDANEIRAQINVFSRAARILAIANIKALPPFEVTTTLQNPRKLWVRPIPKSFSKPISEEPKLVKWEDFPNSDDTEWSKQHPDCPMGVPCFCDCKCHGAPPQNFVEPPPVPTTPCPPRPPLPNPFMLSRILIGQQR